MAKEASQRAYAELHKDEPWHDGSFTFWAKEYSAATPFHFDDGVNIWVSEHDLTPKDMFLG